MQHASLLDRLRVICGVNHNIYQMCQFRQSSHRDPLFHYSAYLSEVGLSQYERVQAKKALRGKGLILKGGIDFEKGYAKALTLSNGSDDGEKTHFCGFFQDIEYGGYWDAVRFEGEPYQWSQVVSEPYHWERSHAMTPFAGLATLVKSSDASSRRIVTV